MKSRYNPVILIGLLFIISCGENKISAKRDSFFLDLQPEEVGLENEFILDLGKKAADLRNIYSFLVIKDKVLVHEVYFNGASAESLLHIRSITKSISSLLIGGAINQGEIPGLDEKVSAYYSDYIKENRGDKIEQVTLDHILDMQTGFDWNESVEAISWYTSVTDTWGYFFEKHVITDPGTSFNYISGAVSLLNRFIESNQELSYQRYAEKSLLDPLGITDFAWEKDGLGNTRADAGLQMRAIDLAKIGYVMMHEGRIDDKQIISSEWIDASWKFEIDLGSNYGPIENLHYNNLWWMGEYAGHEVFFGLGYGGQLLLCVPDHDLIIVTNHEFRLSGNVVASHSSDFLNKIFKPLMDELTN